jgi:response regulator RpfG family c-di-GMP phosphodiesterase
LLDMPAGIEDTPFEKLSEEHQQLYLSHPLRGVRLLEEVPEMPREVLTIIAQHHESGKEAGFPRNIPVSEVFPMARIVRLLDEFSQRLLNTDLSARKPTKRLLDDILVDPTLGTFDFTTTCAMQCLLETGQVASAIKRFAIAITEKRSV